MTTGRINQISIVFKFFGKRKKYFFSKFTKKTKPLKDHLVGIVIYIYINKYTYIYYFFVQKKILFLIKKKEEFFLPIAKSVL